VKIHENQKQETDLIKICGKQILNSEIRWRATYFHERVIPQPAPGNWFLGGGLKHRPPLERDLQRWVAPAPAHENMFPGAVDALTHP